MIPVKVAMVAFAVLAALPAAHATRWLSRQLADGAEPPAAPLMLAVTSVAYAWAALVVPSGWILAASLGLGFALLTLAAVDVIALRLPDALTLPAAAAGLAVSAVLPGAPVLDHLLGTVIGYGALAGLALAYRRVRRREGIGLGDAKLLAVAGAWLGWAALPSVLLIGCLIAFAWIAVARLRRHAPDPAAPIAFGAPLALATWIVWLHGPLTV
jgi:leader peptidase (prepilin peptidase)/N-methyltransferase